MTKLREGFYFAFEDLTTQPAQLDILGPRQARLAIVEGRYHQVKRMFGHFDNKVVRLHRESMGAIHLDPGLAPGAFRELTADEIATVQAATGSTASSHDRSARKVTFSPERHLQDPRPAA